MKAEFSRLYRLDELGTAPRAVTIEAGDDERSALAKRFGLLSIARLSADAELRREGDVVLAEGKLDADVVQACVASGEPVPAVIAENFTLRFVPARQDHGTDEIELEESELDEVEYEGGAVDLGEAVAQTLALSLDPFPRAAGADEKLREAGVIGEGEAGAFAALKALKGKV